MAARKRGRQHVALGDDLIDIKLSNSKFSAKSLILRTVPHVQKACQLKLKSGTLASCKSRAVGARTMRSVKQYRVGSIVPMNAS
jgi:hypothetical protein